MTDTPETDDLARGNHVVPTTFAEQLERERDEAREQRDRLREALRRLAWVITLPDPIDAVRNIATEALQSLTPPNNP